MKNFSVLFFAVGALFLFAAPLPAFDHHEAGLAATGEADYPRAVAEFSVALADNSRDALALFRRGNAYFLQGDYDRAIQDYTAALNLTAVAYLHRGNAYFNKGEYAAALENYGQLLALIPDDAEALAMQERAREAAGAEETGDTNSGN
jgi:tetratricopeptide (TPR) repeat protein